MGGKRELKHIYCENGRGARRKIWVERELKQIYCKNGRGARRKIWVERES